MDTGFITINTHSSIRINAGPGAICYVDPFRFEAEPRDADLILITHPHFDHFSPEDIARVRKPDTTFVLPAFMMHEFIKAGYTHESAAFCVPGETICPRDVQIEVVPAYITWTSLSIRRMKAGRATLSRAQTARASTWQAIRTTSLRTALSPAMSRSCPWAAPTPWTLPRRRHSPTPSLPRSPSPRTTDP